MRLRAGATILLASPAAALLLGGGYSVRFAVLAFTRPDHFADIAKYLVVSPAALALTYATAGGLCFLMAPLLVWLLRHPTSVRVVATGVALVIEIGGAVAAICVAWQHNPQGESHGL